MRALLLEHGHDKERVCAAFAAAYHRGEVERVSMTTKNTPEAWAAEIWADGHKPSGDQWIPVFCRENGIPL